MTTKIFPISVALLVAPILEAAPFLKEIEGADPTIFSDNGVYYMSYTSHPSGFPVLISDDLRTWRAPNGHPQQLALMAGDNVYGTQYFFAPQFLKYSDTDYVLAYSANLKISVAHATKITGPYTNRKKDGKEYLEIDGIQNIDQFIFKDDDNCHYIYFAHYIDETSHGGLKGNTIRVARYDPQSEQIVPGTEKECLRVTSRPGESWENTLSNAQFGMATIEGPSVVKMGNKYYMFYTANDYQCIDYAVGYATSQSPMGPWTKYPGNPIISRQLTGENGSGHGDFFIGNDGSPYYVYHVHNGASGIHPRKLRIARLNKSYNRNAGIYDISVAAGEIIKPKHLYTGVCDDDKPELLYAIGTTEGSSWDVNDDSYPLFHDGHGKYSGDIKVWEADGNAQLAFFPVLGSWENRYCPSVNHERLSLGQPSQSLVTNSNTDYCYLLPKGEYRVEVDIANSTVTILPKRLYAVGLLGQAWDSSTLWNFNSDQYPLTYMGDGKYSGKIETWANNDGYSQLAFIPGLGCGNRYAPAYDHEQIRIGDFSSLHYGTSDNCYFLQAGVFQVTVDIIDNNVTMYHHSLYPVGTMTGSTWDINDGRYRLQCDGNGMYTGAVKAWAALDGYAQMAFFPVLGSWDNRHSPSNDRELLEVGKPSPTLSISGGDNCYIFPPGEYDVTIDINSLQTMIHYPEHLYAIGTMGSTNAWDISTPVYPIDGDGKGVYSGNIEVWPVLDSGSLSQLSFVSKLTGDWSDIGRYRYGPNVDHTLLQTGTESQISKTDNTCYLLHPGRHNVKINLHDGTISISEIPDISTGLEQPSNIDTDLNVSLNCGSDVLTIKSSRPLGKINIYSMAGVLYRALDTNQELIHVNTRNFPPGCYIIRCQYTSKKIIINR